MSNMERVEGDVIETSNPGPSMQDLQDEINELGRIVREQKEEIENIRVDNSVLKETIVRMQIRNVGLME